jgi:hypothetical protein
MSERSRRAILRRIGLGLFKSPTKNPAVAAKVRAALLLRIQQGRWKRPTPPDRDPLTGRWKPKSEPLLQVSRTLCQPVGT